MYELYFIAYKYIFLRTNNRGGLHKNFIKSLIEKKRKEALPDIFRIQIVQLWYKYFIII